MAISENPLTNQEREELIDLWAAKFYATKKQRLDVLPRQLDDMLMTPGQGIAYVRLFLDNLRAGVADPFPRDGEKHPRQASAATPVAPPSPAPQPAAPAPRSAHGWGETPPEGKKKKRETKERPSGWRGKLQINEMGNPLSNFWNAHLALSEADEMRDVFGFDEMLRVVVLLKPIPGTDEPNFRRRVLADVDVNMVQRWLQDFQQGMRVVTENTGDARDRRGS